MEIKNIFNKEYIISSCMTAKYSCSGLFLSSLKHMAHSFSAFGVVVMCFMSNVYICSRGGPSSADLVDEEHFNKFMAERRPQVRAFLVMNIYLKYQTLVLMEEC